MKPKPQSTPRIEQSGAGNTPFPAATGDNSPVPGDDEIFRDPFADFAPSGR
jgi:hypothetical protein